MKTEQGDQTKVEERSSEEGMDAMKAGFLEKVTYAESWRMSRPYTWGWRCGEERQAYMVIVDAITGEVDLGQSMNSLARPVGALRF